MLLHRLWMSHANGSAQAPSEQACRASPCIGQEGLQGSACGGQGRGGEGSLLVVSRLLPAAEDIGELGVIKGPEVPVPGCGGRLTVPCEGGCVGREDAGCSSAWKQGA